MKESVKEICDLGVEYVKIEPALPTDVSRPCQDLSPDPIDFAQNLYETIMYVEKEQLNIKIDTAYFAKPATGYYCGMAEGNFTVTPEGFIIPCVEVARSTDPYFENLFVGKITSENVNINSKNIEYLKTLKYENFEGGCRSCKYRLICLGGCPMANIWQGGLPVKKSKYTCVIMHYFLPKIMLAISKNERILNILIEEPKIKKEV